ncbi:branched-chain amino acid ABC transporter permease [Hippea maritima]|uniref:ABC-type transporter, integral membrane subunit n=1 Tax=Hippea maritima (strain ATCC 700847 / DSM 10411 / MH2) TaxID=760142 RepID=F2LX51_HIPMA|nr:branched-chain amino acid ABC transporter permease [Hippea maritima]AEA33109.1 ABC-type transporter, integral membrane subunit [Hippea maritima DSM 10411]
MNSTIILQQLVNGISLGSLYGLVAIGYTMVYGVIRLINFAHGDVMMVGMYFAFVGVAMMFLPWWAAFLLSMFATAIVGVLIDRIAYKPLRNASRISALITAIGVSFFLENLFLVVFGGVPKAFPVPSLFGGAINVNGVIFPNIAIITPIVAIVFLLMLLFVLYRTKYGMAMRALSLDMETVRIMGINVDLIISMVFAIGSLLAALGGVFWAMRYPAINPLIGIMPGLKAFAAAVLGGIGSVTGAAVGGFIIGISEILVVAFFPSLAGYKDAFAFLFLIFVLLFKPTGIMGEDLERGRF